MCRKHLLGEHLEMHMFAGSIRKGISLAGYISSGLVEAHNIVSRHDILAGEMNARGYLHLSPISDVTHGTEGSVDVKRSAREITERCVECGRLQGTDKDASGRTG